MRACVWLVLFAAWSTACSSTAAPVMPPTPPRQTAGVFSGGLCNGDHCTCRPANAAGDGGAGVPENGQRRFEVRLASAQELWAKIGATTMYKSPEQVEACWYVDLPAGDTPVELRASNAAGISAELAIHELGTKTKSWYDTFHFNCGHPGACSYDELEAFKNEYRAHQHQVADLCGSVKIKGLVWNAQHAPDAVHPGDLLLDLVLDVYKREPSLPHGDPGCGHVSKQPAAGSNDVPVP